MEKIKLFAKNLLCFIETLFILYAGNIYSQKIIKPYEMENWYVPESEIDKIVFKTLKGKNLKFANPCSDEVFIRRIYLDTIGILPEPEKVINFINDKNPDKRKILIDELLEKKEFAEYWSMKWSDILRIKAEFPINLWPNGVQAYHSWILNSLMENKPYDKFVRELLTSSGSNFRNPPVNFYRAIQGRNPYSIASAICLTFMGVRFEKLPKEIQEGMSRIFSKVSYKKSLEWKEEIVYFNNELQEPVEGILPDGTKVKIPPDKDPREVFADWLIKPENPYFSKNIVNRIWSWIFGRGIIHQPDDITPENPPAIPELLTYLEKELVKSNYNLKHIYRIIFNSRTYQQSFIPESNNPELEKYFAYYSPKRLSAEVLLDIICKISGTGVEYISPIPEPYTFIPPEQRNVLLGDGSITGPFLELFGRPPRDTGYETERKNQIDEKQMRYLLNSSELHKKIQSSQYIRNLIKETKNDKKKIIENIYLTLLSRYPTQPEEEILSAYFNKSGISLNQAIEDIIWALINSKEFLYNH
ncbi:MAG: DUF1553 domain-containing protein [Candidatus Omnitrophica bacterium]|nr:DUF1553 domain-containing protein [Candidatus Omnitrophota bacterium]MCM8802155.1 DUF1553 domain-containing protein [Candidatus Omnitrophota bacterium]